MTTLKEFGHTSQIEPEVVAGVAIVFNNSILLVHPTNASWHKSALGIPKGHVEVGEDYKTAAIRELAEETGIILNEYDLDNDYQSSPVYNNKGEIKSVLIYYVKYIESLDEIGLTSNKVDKIQLQLKEVDWAGFVPILDAYPKMHRFQMIILDRLKNK